MQRSKYQDWKYQQHALHQSNHSVLLHSHSQHADQSWIHERNNNIHSLVAFVRGSSSKQDLPTNLHLLFAEFTYPLIAANNQLPVLCVHSYSYQPLLFVILAVAVAGY